MSKPRAFSPPDGSCRRCGDAIITVDGWATVNVQPRERDFDRYNLCGECTYQLLNWLCSKMLGCAVRR
jgi:hypothetical protein